MDEETNSEAMITNGEFRLPEVIIQRIQSFLDRKQAAQTTILSRSWYTAWFTRPNLDLDERYDYDDDYEDDDDDDDDYETDRFSAFARKTIKRYEESNLKIESFSLCMMESVRDDDDSDLAYQLIVKALKLGATRLSLRIQDGFFVLPLVVLASENLVHLSVEECIIDVARDHKVRCSRLESLSLRKVEVESYMISQIISSCPLIENLSLSDIKSRRRRYWTTNRLNFLPNLHNLSCLVLSHVKIDTLFFGRLSSKFPSLKDFTIANCRFNERTETEILISSHSLERLTFEDTYLTVKFDVPHIRKFTFKGSYIPLVSFKSTSSEWESHVVIKNDNLNTSWFSELNNFLRELSLSKIYLSVKVESSGGFDYEAGDIQCSLKNEVENLTVGIMYVTTLCCYALFDGLFRLCRPKFITQYWHPDHSSNEFLCKRLVQGMNEKCSFPSQFMYGLNDLNEVNVEIFEENVAEWRSVPLISLLDASTSPKEKQEVRFQLKWRLQRGTI